jgi:lipopolysaccharide/colanic/teichoic acid biosynthesis glycosyltransferase
MHHCLPVTDSTASSQPNLQVLELFHLIPEPLPTKQALIWAFSAKRWFDLLFSTGALALLLPVMAVVILLVRLSGPGPIFYTQTRVGRRGKLFTIFKFRTMRNRVDHLGCTSTEGDPRVTTIGRILRRTKIDELPQLWNVIRGEMSLIGPRPLSLDETHQILESGMPALYPGLIPQTLPGLTGLEQVHRRSSLTYRDRFLLNHQYERDVCCRNDALILLWTILMYKSVPLATGLTFMATVAGTLWFLT